MNGEIKERVNEQINMTKHDIGEEVKDKEKEENWAAPRSQQGINGVILTD